MEYHPLKRCSICGKRSPDSACPKCLPEIKKKALEKAASRKAPAPDTSFYQSRLWKDLRDMCLAKHPYCQGTRPDTTPCYSVYKLQADHKIPRSQGGPDTLANLQTLCQDCHVAKTNRENGIFPTHGQVIAVCGPPGSGKTHYVKAHWQYGDLLIDLDRITASISIDTYLHEPMYLLRMAWSMRDAALKQAENRSTFSRLWILETAASRLQRESYRTRYDARVIVLKPPQSTCIDRCKADPERPRIDWESIIKDWYQQYRSSPMDTVITDYL